MAHGPCFLKRVLGLYFLPLYFLSCPLLVLMVKHRKKAGEKSMSLGKREYWKDSRRRATSSSKVKKKGLVAIKNTGASSSSTEINYEVDNIEEEEGEMGDDDNVGEQEDDSVAYMEQQEPNSDMETSRNNRRWTNSSHHNSW